MNVAMIRWVAAWAVTLILTTLFAGCMASAPTGRGTTAPPSDQCPPAGTSVPLAQLVAQTARFTGCDITTDAIFQSTGQGNYVLPFDVAGMTVFRILPPGQAVMSDPLGGSNATFAAVPDAMAGPLFSLQPGASLRLQGRMELQLQRDAAGTSMDVGVAGRLLRVSTITPAAGP